MDGLTVCGLFLEFFKFFNNFLVENHYNKPVLLILDGHKSHTDHDNLEFAHTNGILGLPAHCTHLLQPLD